MIGKRMLCILLSCVLLLCVGCGSVEEENPNTEPSVGTTTGEPITTPQAQDTTSERLAYYEQLVGQLQGELLAMKAELFAAKTEHEERLANLEAQAEKAPQVSDFTYTVSSSGVTLTAYNGTALNIEIPATVDNRPVIAIGDRMLLNNTNVQSVVIPEGVKSVGWFAFSGCIALGAVSMPASVESVSYGAFENCPSSLTIFCPAGSYAERYAQSFGIRTVS